MAKLLKILNPQITQYRDRRFKGTEELWDLAISSSTTVYVGNLSFYTREEQVYDVFSRVGQIKRVIMGLDRDKRTPCGFCFVIYYLRSEAEDCVKYLNGTMLDDRPIRVDIDWGYEDGRQFGRGRSGGQVRDEFRQDYDPGRGGYGHQTMKQLAEQLMEQAMAVEQGEGLEGEEGGEEDADQPAVPAVGAYDPQFKRRRVGPPGGFPAGVQQVGEGAATEEDNPRFAHRDDDPPAE